jgi:hypothetical protein
MVLARDGLGIFSKYAKVGMIPETRQRGAARLGVPAIP